MRTKMLLLAAVAAVCLAAAPTDASADHILCSEPQAQWTLLQSNGATLSDVTSFRTSFQRHANICPALSSTVEQRYHELTTRQAERARLQAEAADRVEGAQARLDTMNRTLVAETAARRRAENQINTLLREREAAEAAAQIPGRARNLVACLISQDVARFDRGNMPGTQVDRMEVPPEIQVVYDIAEAAQGVIDVYGWDLDQRQWSRSRVASELVGGVLTIGSISENDHNARVLSRATLNLDAMTISGNALFEPINAGGQSALNLSNSGQASLNVGALFQRPPRAWLETRGNCAYQTGAPPGPLTGTPTWRVAERTIPTVPPMPRR